MKLTALNVIRKNGLKNIYCKIPVFQGSLVPYGIVEIEINPPLFLVLHSVIFAPSQEGMAAQISAFQFCYFQPFSVLLRLFRLVIYRSKVLLNALFNFLLLFTLSETSPLGRGQKRDLVLKVTGVGT
jgi:hypothetical protein